MDILLVAISGAFHHSRRGVAEREMENLSLFLFRALAKHLLTLVISWSCLAFLCHTYFSITAMGKSFNLVDLFLDDAFSVVESDCGLA